MVSRVRKCGFGFLLKKARMVQGWLLNHLRPLLMDLFKSLNETTQQKIISAHRLVHPLWSVMLDSGTLSGNAGEISVAAELFYNTVIIPAYQDPILNALKDILKANGYSTKLSIKQSKTCSIHSWRGCLMQTLTINEIREKLRVMKNRNW